MKQLEIYLLAILFVVANISVCAQQSHSFVTSHYKKKVIEFQQMRPIDSTDVVMLGNSLTEYAGDWNKLLRWEHVRNRGIAGDDANGIYRRLDQILQGKPKKIFLMCGINDISHDLSATEVASRCEKVIRKIRANSPATKLYVQSILPINETFGMWETLHDKSDMIPQVNRYLRQYCQQNSITYIDLYHKFVRHGTAQLRKPLTVDGLHLSKTGYKIWSFELRQYLLE